MWEKVVDFVSLKVLSKIKWDALKVAISGRSYDLKPRDREYIRTMLKDNVFLWVTRRETHLTTYLIGFADWALQLKAWVQKGFKGARPHFGFWSHTFFNIDDNEVIEAIAKGVKQNFFDDVFDVDAVACLTPRFMSHEEWLEVQPHIVEELKKQKGKKYDSMFDIQDESRVSCIELVRLVLKQRVKDYDKKFSDFEQLFAKYNNLTPDMLYNSKSFQVVYEVRYK